MGETIPLIDLASPIKELLYNLTFYHYGVAGFLGVVFILFFILAVMLRKKPLVSALFFLFSALMSGPAMLGGYVLTEEYLRRVDVTEFNVKRLEFVKAFVITGSVKNSGKLPFKKTYIKVKFVKKDSRWWMQIKNFYTPVAEELFTIDETIGVGASSEFKFLADTTKLKNLNSLVVYTVYKAF